MIIHVNVMMFLSTCGHCDIRHCHECVIALPSKCMVPCRLLHRPLEEDTCLLASEQRHVLRAELEANKAGARVCRPALYQHTSPGERMLMTVGKFLDATVSQMPNRRRGVEAVLASIDSGVIPSRAMLLDRWVQHTSICADSRGAHRNIKVGHQHGCSGA